MEVKMNELVLPEVIRWNYQDIKDQLTAKTAHFENLVYTEDQLKEAKADKAELNSLKKALNDERIRLEKEYMKPFNEFKAQINEIIGIIDRPVGLIDAQVKAFDEKKKEDKKVLISTYFESLPKPFDEIKLAQIWNEKWLNASVSMNAVKKEIGDRFGQIMTDLETISSLQSHSFEASEKYKRDLDIAEAIKFASFLAGTDAKKENKSVITPEDEVEELTEIEPVEPQEDDQVIIPAEDAREIHLTIYANMGEQLDLLKYLKVKGIQYKIGE